MLSTVPHRPLTAAAGGQRHPLSPPSAARGRQAFSFGGAGGAAKPGGFSFKKAPAADADGGAGADKARRSLLLRPDAFFAGFQALARACFGEARGALTGVGVNHAEGEHIAGDVAFNAALHTHG